MVAATTAWTSAEVGALADAAAPGSSSAGFQPSKAARVAGSTDSGFCRKRSYSSKTYPALTPSNRPTVITYLSYRSFLNDPVDWHRHRRHAPRHTRAHAGVQLHSDS